MKSIHCFCGYCGKEISMRRTEEAQETKKWSRRSIVHINICQDPSRIYFCSQQCKLNWIFKSPDEKLNKDNNDNLIKKELKPVFKIDESDEESSELDDYLKDNHLKIIRKA